MLIIDQTSNFLEINPLSFDEEVTDGYTNKILLKTLTNEDIAKLLPEGSPTPNVMKGKLALQLLLRLLMMLLSIYPIDYMSIFIWINNA